MKMTKKELFESTKLVYLEQERESKIKKVLIATSIISIVTLMSVFLPSCQSVEPPEGDCIIEDNTQELLNERWNERYASITEEYDNSVDMEVGALREKLNPHGISVMRVNPNNAEHQRRYRRHLLGSENPSMEITDYQVHEAHSIHGSYGTDCTWCRKEILDGIANRLNTFSQTQGS
tara:strand:- start:538 stop:1068 length:531 start_codon:yes stop_codon:yes gene_type:complete